MIKNRVKINSFLTEREDRFKPNEANKLKLKRVNKIDFSGEIHLVDHKPTRTNMILVKKGDLLISGINAEKGAISVYEYEEDAIATIHYSSYSYDDKKIDFEYLKWFLKSNIFKNTLIEQAGSGIKSELKAKKFLKLEIDLPELQDQMEIVAKMASVNEKIEELNELNQENESLLFQLSQSILQDAIQGKLTAEWRKQNPDVEPASELLKRIQVVKEQLIEEKKIKIEKLLPKIKANEIPFEIPESWMWCKMQDLCPNISSGSTPPKSEFTNKGIPYLKVYNIQNQQVKFDYKPQYISKEYHIGRLKRSILKPGDVIFNIVGPPLGKTAIIPNDYAEWNCNQAIAFFKPLFTELNIWIYTFFLSEDYIKRIELIGTAGQDNISVTKSKNIEIPLPPLKEQEVIYQKVCELKNVILSLKEQVEFEKRNAELLLQSVLSELLEAENTLIETHQKEKMTIPPARAIKYDSKTTLMELVALLKKHGKLHAEDLWKMSEHFDNKNIGDSIDKFYADLKQKIEIDKVIKEVENEKGYLELV